MTLAQTKIMILNLGVCHRPGGRLGGRETLQVIVLPVHIRISSGRGGHGAPAAAPKQCHGRAQPPPRWRAGLHPAPPAA